MTVFTVFFYQTNTSLLIFNTWLKCSILQYHPFKISLVFLDYVSCSTGQETHNSVFRFQLVNVHFGASYSNYKVLMCSLIVLVAHSRPVWCSNTHLFGAGIAMIAQALFEAVLLSLGSPSLVCRDHKIPFTLPTLLETFFFPRATLSVTKSL